MGIIMVPWDQISEIKSDAPLNVILPSGTVQATVASSVQKPALAGKSSFADRLNFPHAWVIPAAMVDASAGPFLRLRCHANRSHGSIPQSDFRLR
jgi:hypothetical protein